MTPKRIQRRRVKGWRMPEGAVYVGRGSKWGNPWRVSRKKANDVHWRRWIVTEDGSPYIEDFLTKDEATDYAIEMYRRHVTSRITTGRLDLVDLAARDLVCWCAEDAACHADLLLWLAANEATR